MTDPKPETREERYIAFSVLIDRTAKNLQKLKIEKMAAFGLRAVHLSCILKLGSAPDGLTGGQLAESCEVDKSLISRILSELEAKEYIAYEIGDKKYRRKITLTEKGKYVLGEVRRILVGAVDAVRGDVSDEEMVIFYRVLGRLDENLSSLVHSAEISSDTE